MLWVNYVLVLFILFCTIYCFLPLVNFPESCDPPLKVAIGKSLLNPKITLTMLWYYIEKFNMVGKRAGLGLSPGQRTLGKTFFTL